MSDDLIPDEVHVTEAGGLAEIWTDTDSAPRMPDMPILVVRQFNVGVADTDPELMLWTVGGDDWKLEYAFGIPLAEAGEVIEMLAQAYYIHTQPEVEAEPVDGAE